MKSCPVCQTTKYLRLTYRFKQGDAYRCQKCGVGIFNGANPKNAGADIDESDLFRFIKRIILTYEFGYLKGLKNKKILEVGSGSGELAKMLSEYGLDMTCNDVDRTSLRRIAKEYRLKTLYGYLETLNIKKNTFDGIVMRHVFEHIDNPKEFIEKISIVLCKGGKLYITQPNYNSATAKIIGKNWSGFSVPSHRYYWTPESLGLFLKRNGFKVNKNYTVFSHYGLPLNLYLNIHNSYLRLLSAPFIFIIGSLVEFIFVLMGRGQNLFIEAEKK